MLLHSTKLSLPLAVFVEQGLNGCLCYLNYEHPSSFCQTEAAAAADRSVLDCAHGAVDQSVVLVGRRRAVCAQLIAVLRR